MKNIADIIDKVHCADSLSFMRDMPDGCVDTIITDPPYGLGFMGKEWDTFVPGVVTDEVERSLSKATALSRGRNDTSAAWASARYDHSRNREFQAWFTIWAQECLRVAKPGAILMAFGGTRTYHRLTCAIEDAGWEIRDCVQWLYGSGFPKSLDISKAIDKAAGVEREVVGDNPNNRPNCEGKMTRSMAGAITVQPITAPTTPLAKFWDGWGTALKPSWEPIIVAMKPLDGTFAQNAEKHGVAGLWIEGGRIGTETIKGTRGAGGQHGRYGPIGAGAYDHEGRFPSNTILSCTCEGDHEPDCPVRMLDEQSGELKSGDLTGQPRTENRIYGSAATTLGTPRYYKGNSGGASRFFYCAKSSRAERNAGCEGMDFVRDADREIDDGPGGENPRNRTNSAKQNHHPTVKPLALMEYLCKLTKTPTGGIVLDPFGGSGSTGLAAYKTNRHYILIEKEQEYVDIAQNRIQAERDKYPLFGEGP